MGVEAAVQVGDSFVQSQASSSQERPTEELQASEVQNLPQPARVSLPGSPSNLVLPDSSGIPVAPNTSVPAVVAQPADEVSRSSVHVPPDPGRHVDHMPERSAPQIGWSIRD